MSISRGAAEVETRERGRIALDLGGEPAGTETVWAERVGSNVYRLLNTPFFAHGYAWGDTVKCIEQDGFPRVVGLERDSGNSTLRIYFASDFENPAVQYVLEELVSVGCNYEQGSDRMVAVNVPPDMEVPFSQMVNFLNGIDEAVLVGWEIGKRPADVK
jgi:hypothetical protein